MLKTLIYERLISDHIEMLIAESTFIAFDNKVRSTVQTGSRDRNHIAFNEILMRMTDNNKIVFCYFFAFAGGVENSVFQT